MHVHIIEADLKLPQHARDLLALINAYAADSMGNGAPLAEDLAKALVPALREHPTTLAFLAYDGKLAVGVALCFLGFSTFAAKQLINIHDLAVVPGHRGQGIGRQLLAAVQDKARALGCCKLTLEVQENNDRARRAYRAFGFEQMHQATDAGGCLFLAKTL